MCVCVNVTLLYIAGLTVDNVRKALHGIPWREVGEMLLIPDSKLSEIEGEYHSDEEREVAVIRYWILRYPFASWRRIIEQLEEWGEHDHAIILYHYREKLTGMLEAHLMHPKYCYMYMYMCIIPEISAGQTIFQAQLPSFILPIIPIRAGGKFDNFFLGENLWLYSACITCTCTIDLEISCYDKNFQVTVLSMHNDPY